MIIIDLSQVMISNYMAQIGNHVSEGTDEGLFRHMVINSIRMMKVKFCNFGEVIIACDDKKSWRKEIFPFYKANRRKDREKSNINWPEIFTVLNKIKQEIKDNFHYKVIQVERAEADDIIGTLSHKFGNMLNTGEKIMICSGDKDFAQLHVYGNVTQYDPVKKRFIAHTDPVQFTRELILKGDRGDGIPNIHSTDDCIANGIRQRKLNVDKYSHFINLRDQLEGEAKKNWLRNEQLIDLSYTPVEIKEKIIKEYELQSGKSSEKVLPYLEKHNLKILQERLGELL